MAKTTAYYEISGERILRELKDRTDHQPRRQSVHQPPKPPSKRKMAQPPTPEKANVSVAAR